MTAVTAITEAIKILCNYGASCGKTLRAIALAAGKKEKQYLPKIEGHEEIDMTLKANVLQEPIPEPRAPSPKPEAPNDKTPQNIERRNDERRNGSTELKKKHFAANSTIFNEGKMGNVAYIIRSGEVEISKGIQSSNPVSMAVLGKGDVLGEMALFDDRPRMASAIALTDVVVIQMSKEEFQERLSTMDPAIKRMVLTMVTRVRNMADEFMRGKAEIEWAKLKKLD